MIIVCQQCTARFRVDDAKVPSGSFTVSCPQCHETVASGGVSSPENSALGVGKSPALSSSGVEAPTPAPLFRQAEGMDAQSADGPASMANQLAAALASLLNTHKSGRVAKTRPSWDRRRALVCTAEKHRETIARGLAESEYEVFVAGDTQQAVERMRESHLDVVLLDQDFDPIEQGTAFVAREVNVLRPADRRRLFFVFLSTSKRTLDTHTAFLQNVNLLVNFNELAELPTILDRSVRAYNELYKDFFAAFDVAPI